MRLLMSEETDNGKDNGKDNKEEIVTPSPRANLIAALDGRLPEWIPYTVNQEFVTADPAWEALFAAGLCPIPCVHTVREEMTEVEHVVEPVTWRVQGSAPDGRGLAFEISEDLPSNWREAIPVVLETLNNEERLRREMK
jgi:hypothetical protein